MGVKPKVDPVNCVSHKQRCQEKGLSKRTNSQVTSRRNRIPEGKEEGQTNFLQWTNSNKTDARETGNKATWHPRGLSDLQETSYKNVLYRTLRLTLINDVSTRKGSHKACVLMRIFPTRKHIFCQEMKVGSTLL